jgi:hypothetical protein
MSQISWQSAVAMRAQLICTVMRMTRGFSLTDQMICLQTWLSARVLTANGDLSTCLSSRWFSVLLPLRLVDRDSGGEACSESSSIKMITDPQPKLLILGAGLDD